MSSELTVRKISYYALAASFALGVFLMILAMWDLADVEDMARLGLTFFLLSLAGVVGVWAYGKSQTTVVVTKKK